ncbi:hypothetical protein STEG23_000323 [Scotinomys teguina]
MPDLSHLTEEERKIILAVMDRQKKEEEKEQSVLKLGQTKKFVVMKAGSHLWRLVDLVERLTVVLKELFGRLIGVSVILVKKLSVGVSLECVGRISYEVLVKHTILQFYKNGIDIEMVGLASGSVQLKYCTVSLAITQNSGCRKKQATGKG